MAAPPAPPAAMHSFAATSAAERAATATTQGPIEFRWHQGAEGLLGASDAAADLWARLPQATLFNSKEWLVPAARCLVPSDRRLLTLVGRQGGRMVACLPLTIGRESYRGLPIRALRILGDPLSDRIELPVDRSVAGALEATLDQLWRCPCGWDAAFVSEIRKDNDLRRKVEAWARRSGRRVRWRPCARSPVLTFGSNGSGPPATYGKALRTRLARARKKLAAAGGYRVERLTPTPDGVPELLDLIARIEAASWKGEDGVGIFTSPERFRFFEEVSLGLAARGTLEIYLLWLGPEAISYRYGFRHRGMFLDYNLAYLPTHAGLSPGRALLDEIIRDCRKRGLAGVDASRGSLRTGHLLAEWTDEAIEHDQLRLFAPTLRGRLLQALELRLEPAAKRMRAATLRHWRASRVIAARRHARPSPPRHHG